MRESTKSKMTASYKAVFVLSILMAFALLFLGAVTKSKGGGVGVWIWAYTAWLMYKRQNESLLTFYNVLFKVDIVFGVLALGFLAFSSEVTRAYLNYSFTTVSLFFAVTTLLNYGLIVYFRKQVSLDSMSLENPTDVVVDDIKDSDKSQSIHSAFSSKIFKVFAIVFIIMFAIFLAWNSKVFNIKKSGDFSTSDCQMCDNGFCEKMPELTGFQVLEDSVQVYFQTDSFQISEWGKDENDRCVIAKNKNSAFQCTSGSVAFSRQSHSTLSFDGVDRLKWFGTNFDGKKFEVTCRAN